MKNIFRNRGTELARILGIEDASAGADSVIGKVTALKEENRRLNNLIDSVDEVKVYGTFLRLANSSAYYGHNKQSCDAVFSEVCKRDKMALMSVDVLREEKHFSEVDNAISDRFKKMGLSHILIKDVSGKGVYLIGFNKRITVDNIIKLFGFTLEQLTNDGYTVLVNFSREFTELSGVFEAYKEIKICRDYRQLGDKHSINTVDTISLDNPVYIPVNFTEELKSHILSGDEKAIREFLNVILDKNMKNRIPVIRFEQILRIMQNTVMDIVVKSEKNRTGLLDMEQFFMFSIERLKSTFDVEGLLNAYVNMIRFSVDPEPKKKNGLSKSDVIKYINSKYTEDLYLEKMAAEFNTTPKYFSNYFKREFSVGFSEYLANLRISAAKRILAETDIALSGVGEKVGYSNPVTFSVAFKKITGMPPGKYREMCRGRN